MNEAHQQRLPVTLARIAEAGGKIADSDGFGAVTASSVARALGIKTASLYAHVSGTSGTREQVTLLALQELADAALLAVAGRSGRDALVALGRTFREYAHKHPGRFDATANPLSADAAQRSAGPVHARILTAILADYGIGTTGATDAEEASPELTHAARYVGATLHGFIRQEMYGSYAHSPADISQSWERALQALHHSLMNWNSIEGTRA